MSSEKIAVIGLGKLGLPFVACWAKKGFEVTGVDVNPEVVELLSKGELTVVEPGVNEMLSKYADNISATTSIQDAVAGSTTVFIFVGTPDEGEGKFTTRFVLSACEEIGKAIKEASDRKQIVLVSSVTAGSIDEEIIPALESASAKKVNEDFDFCYSPVFIALGTMVRDYYSPDMALIGQSGEAAGERLWGLLQKFYDKKDVVLARTNFVNAELIKLTLSTFITTKISYGNMLAELCQRIPGADADVIVEAMGLDSRVSPKVLKGAMPYGGPCFPRDNRALMYLMKKWNVDGRLVDSTDEYNSAMVERIASRIQEYTVSGGSVAFLGVTFKSNTSVVDESAAIDVIKQLVERGFKVSVYDPEGLEGAKAIFGDSIEYGNSVSDVTDKADTVFIATPWAEFAELSASDFSFDRKVTVIDMWRMVDASKLGSKIDYIPFGRYHEPVRVEQAA